MLARPTLTRPDQTEKAEPTGQARDTGLSLFYDDLARLLICAIRFIRRAPRHSSSASEWPL